MGTDYFKKNPDGTIALNLPGADQEPIVASQEKAPLPTPAAPKEATPGADTEGLRPENPTLAREGGGEPSEATTAIVTEVIDPRDVPDKLPTIAGRVLKPSEWVAFETYAKTGNLRKAAEAAGVTEWTLWSWRKQTWWGELHRQFIREHQEDFHSQMATRQEEILDGYFDVATGADKTDRTANARIQAARLYSEMGDDPLVKKRAAVEIHQNTANFHGRIDISKIKNLGAEKLLEWHNTGVMPPEMLEDN